MISCTEFIYAYSEVFRYIEERDGYDQVFEYWKTISDDYVDPSLGEWVRKNGLHGCYDYWFHSLNEEAADFRMEYDGDNKTFSITMRDCPSKGRLLASGKDYYPRYCEHCDILYRRVLEREGFDYDIDLSKTDHACCTIHVKEKK